VARAGDDGARAFKADKRYLLFPCTRGLSGQNKGFLNVDAKPYLSQYDALIASSDPDHWKTNNAPGWADIPARSGSVKNH